MEIWKDLLFKWRLSFIFDFVIFLSFPLHTSCELLTFVFYLVLLYCLCLPVDGAALDLPLTSWSFFGLFLSHLPLVPSLVPLLLLVAAGNMLLPVACSSVMLHSNGLSL